MTAHVVEDSLARVASVAARLAEAIADGDRDYALTLAAELETQLRSMLTRLREQS